MKKIITILLLFVSILVFSQNEIYVQATAGQLAENSELSNPSQVKRLIVAGSLNAVDFKFLRDNLPALNYLDIKDVDVVAYAGAAGTVANNTSYLANTIPQNAFSNNLSLEEILLPSNVLTIGRLAFYKCLNLKQVQLPGSLLLIDDYAFDKCALEELTIPDSVTKIGNGVFQDNNSLREIILGTGLQSIGTQAFYECLNLRIVHTHRTTPPSLSGSVFSFTLLSMVYVVNAAAKTAYKNAAGWSEFKIGIEEWKYVSTVTAGTLANKLPNAGEITKLKIDGPLNGADITYIKNNMHYLLELDLSDASLLNNKLPDKAFQNMFILRNVILPASIEHIGDDAFASCVNFDANTPLPANLTTIGARAFFSCKMMRGGLSFPASLESIGNSAFENCSALNGEIVFSQNILNIGSNAFKGCSSLKGSIDLPNSIATLGINAFQACISLDGTLTLPTGLQAIPNNLFYGCRNLGGTLTIPESVTSIGNSSFHSCSTFDTLVLPSSISSIGTSAFHGWTGLTKIYSFATTPPTLATNSFNLVKATTQVVVPPAALNAYKAANFWKYFINNITANDTTFETTILFDNTKGSILLDNQLLASDAVISTDMMGSISLELIPVTGFVVNTILYGNEDITHALDGNMLIINEVNADSQLEVVFDYKSHKIYTTISGNGTMSIGGVESVSGGYVFVYEGDPVELIFTPNEWNHIESFKLNGVELKHDLVDNTYTLQNVQNELDVELKFADTLFEVVVSRSNFGLLKHENKILQKSETLFVKGGTSLAIEIVPNSGHPVEEILFNDTAVTGEFQGAVYVTPIITGDATLYVKFEGAGELYAFDFIVGSGGTLKFNDEFVSSGNIRQVEAGDTVVVKTIPSPHFKIEYLKVGDTDITDDIDDGTYTFVAAASTQVDVQFEIIKHKVFINQLGNGVVKNQMTGSLIVDSVIVNDGDDLIVLFEPAAGSVVDRVRLGETNLKPNVVNNILTIGNISNSDTLHVVFEERRHKVMIKDPISPGSFEFLCLSNSELRFNIIAGEDWGIASVMKIIGNSTIDLEDVNGVYMLENINDDIIVEVLYVYTGTSSLSPSIANNVHVYSKDSKLHVQGLDIGERISIVTSNGAVVYSGNTVSDTEIIPLDSNQVYVIVTSKGTYKILN